MEPLITFIAPAYMEIPANRAFIDSMIMQTNQNFRAIIFHNGQNNELCDYIHDLKRDNIIYQESETDTGYWGTRNRQQAIKECTTEYIVQTSIQDYWLPQAVEYITQALQHRPDIVLWDSVNHVVGPCRVLDAQLEWSKVDWGNFCIKTSIAQKIGIRHGDKYTADWLFINDCKDAGLLNNIVKLPLLLTIHNTILALIYCIGLQLVL